MTTPKRGFWTRLRLRLPGTPRTQPDAPDATLGTLNVPDSTLTAAAQPAENSRRTRHAMAEAVQAGYQSGPPPYGYRNLRIRVTDRNGHGRFRVVLVPDWRTAAIVTRIFTWRADDGLGFRAISTRLNREPRQYPTPTESGRWSPQAVRRVVTNPRYTGRQVWARTVAGQPVPPERWITSAPRAHEPLVDDRTFRRAQPPTRGGAR